MIRDSWRTAADLALLGILVSLGCLPVVTAGAAVGAGSSAIARLVTLGRWPSAAECWSSFRSRLVPGLWAGPAVLAVGWLIAVDIAALRRGAVPGGGPLIIALLVVAALGAGFVAVVAGVSGRREPRPREPRPREPVGLPATGGSLRRARALVAARPGALAAVTAVVLIAALLAAFIHPALVPVLAGYVLFAVHAVLRRVTPPTPEPSLAAATPVAAR
ncbi:hypothetical protein KOI35_33110 [Actinoplanes bogorensis]|uniref:DUF624 domain-containing protein n=1 Tax=Paractinoplanes bogorensis TaxID=1610840 RepID=A0ABS5YY38_9ACTN|nr:hypothetical protein [Actinoplanes bogorensis]MBU2668364.1 hypothetical protein [Actinoplanes bogorensis]